MRLSNHVIHALIPPQSRLVIYLRSINFDGIGNVRVSLQLTASLRSTRFLTRSAHVLRDWRNVGGRQVAMQQFSSLFIYLF